MKICGTNLVVVIAIVTSACIGIVFLSVKSNDSTTPTHLISTDNTTIPTYSIPADNPTKTIQQYYEHSNIDSCSKIKEINYSYSTCIISNSSASGIGNLSSPIFKYVNNLGASNYPPPLGFFQVELKTNLLSQEQMEKVIDVIKNDPGIKSQSFAWKIRDMGFYPFKYSWYDDVRLTIHGIRDSSEKVSCGWYATVTIDLNTLSIVKKENTNVTSYEKC